MFGLVFLLPMGPWVKISISPWAHVLSCVRPVRCCKHRCLRHLIACKLLSLWDSNRTSSNYFLKSFKKHLHIFLLNSLGSINFFLLINMHVCVTSQKYVGLRTPALGSRWVVAFVCANAELLIPVFFSSTFHLLFLSVQDSLLNIKQSPNLM